VDFTAVGAPAHPDGVYRWYHGYPPGVLRKTGTVAEGGNYYTSTVYGPAKRVVRVTYTLDDETSAPDICIMWYVQARMELDGAPSSEEYNPGLFIGLDDNNSDEFYGEGDDSLDYLQTGNFGWPLAEDFRGLKFKLDVSYSLWPHDGQFTLRFTAGGDSIIRPFEQGQEGWVPVNLGNYQKDATRDWQWLWLQGKGFGTSVIELELPLPGTESAKDRVGQGPGQTDHHWRPGR